MKKILLVVFLLGLVSCLFSYYNSVAFTDNFLAPKVNPAAMGFGNANGIAFLGNYDEDGFYEDYYSVFFNSDNFAYVIDRIGNNNYHKLALSTANTKLSNNLYFGFAWDWKNKYFKKGDISESILYRPFDFLSLGTVIYDLFEEDVNYKVGVAIRPVFIGGKTCERITLTADSHYDESDWRKPVFGIQTEVLDGFLLGGAYDLEDETFCANFGITFENLGIGSTVDMDKDNEFSQGQYYINFSEKSYRSIIGKKKNYFVDYELKGEILEKRKGQKIGPFTVYMGKEKTLSQIIKDIKKMKEDDDVKGLVFKSGNFKAKFAQRTELKDALLDFKAEGKNIIFYYEMITGANYTFAASVADEIYLNPIGMINLKGISISLPYVKNLLDTLGIDVINFRSHDYKTAGNILSEDHMTEAERESYEYLIDGIYEEMVKMIADGRGDKLTKSVDEIIDEGPYWNAQRALELGLIDDVIYEDELEDKIKDKYAPKEIVEKYRKSTMQYDWSKERKDKIAIIYAVGNIHSGKGVSGKSIGSETTAELIKKAREDKSVKGIIIRVDSGGGSALASDVINREVAICKTGKDKKPVIISMGGVAGSGGYYIAASADKIIAQPNTITGSIGVVGIFPGLERLYKKILINWDTVKRGKHSDIGSTNRQMTEEEKQMVEKAIHHIYEKFIDVVAEGRNMSTDDVHKIAQGRVWTGKQAFERGLVDALGGLDIAVKEMKKLANLKREVELVEFEDKKKGMEISLDMMTKKSDSLNIPDEIRSLLELGDKLLKFGDENILMILPYDLEFK